MRALSSMRVAAARIGRILQAYLLTLSCSAWAQKAAQDYSTADLDQMSLKELLNLSVDVASHEARPIRETPGVVTVISREEILRSGSRDLVDVLLRIPGFMPALDSKGVTSLGFRGVWGQEGKILLLVDGLEYNENLFGTLQLASRIPLQQVKLIEIVRGPGSAMYGGHAELAVINVTMLGPGDLEGGSVRLTGGTRRREYARWGVDLAGGHTFEKIPGLSVAATGSLGRAVLSDRRYTSLSGRSFDLSPGNERVDPQYINVAVKYRGLQLRYLHDSALTVQRDDLGEPLDVPSENDFISNFVDLRYALHSDRPFKLDTGLTFRRQRPWSNSDQSSIFYREKQLDRLSGFLTASYRFNDRLTGVAGAAAYRDHGTVLHPEIVSLENQFGGEPQVTYYNGAIFSELLFNHEAIGNLNAGLRVERHNHFGNSFVPRLGYTKQWRWAHIKALYSRAFRAPDLEPLNLNPGIRPERATAIELETGFNFEHWVGSLNLFDGTVTGPIVYTVNGVRPTYANLSRTGSRGAELDLRALFSWGSALLNYGFYTGAGKNGADPYAVEGRPHALLAFPNHKLTVGGTCLLHRGLSLQATVVLMGSRYSGTGVGVDGRLESQRLGPTALLDIYLRQTDLFIKGLSAGIGLFNATNSSFKLAQGYNGGHAPLPALDRELLLRLEYAIAP